MAVKRCVDCGKSYASSKHLINWKECPYCEHWLCQQCVDKQKQVFSWNGCHKCCIEYRNLLVK